MTSPNLRSAQAALDVARPLIVRLDERRHPEDAAADLIEGWAAIETALRAMIGGSSLGGQALVSEVRAQGRLDYPHAHALLGFLAARDRATRPDYHPTSEDVAAARAGFQSIEAANGLGIAADTGLHRTVTPPGAVLPPPGPPPVGLGREVRAPGAAPGNGVPPASYGQSYGRDLQGRDPQGRDPQGRDPQGRDPQGRDLQGRDSHGRDPAGRVGTALPPDVGTREPARRRGVSPALAAGLAILLLVLAGGAYLLFGRTRSSSALDQGVAAFQGGRREAARAAFERAATEQPGLSMARVYLGRLAREDGDIPRATAYLDTAIRLDTTNAVAFREMGQLQLYANRPQLAVSFFRRAIERDADDRVAQGWMACALTRVGNAEVAERFYTRAGTGEWTACRQSGPMAPRGVPGGVPGAPPAVGGTGVPVGPGARQPLTP